MFANFSRERHVRLLVEALNVSAFLCAESCIAPPGFPAECGIARDAMSRRAKFLENRLMRLPMREATLDEYFDKKHREYSLVAGKYAGLFDYKSANFLRKHAHSIIPRTSNVGGEIVSAWTEGPDRGGIWDRLIKGVPVDAIEKIRLIPQALYDQGLAVTWPAIAMRAVYLSDLDFSRFRFALQHHYFSIYIQEFGLRVVTGLPFARTSFGLAGQDLRYDYEALRASLLPVNLWRLVVGASAQSLLDLRLQQGYFLFRDSFDKVTGTARSPREIAEVFAIAAEGMRSVPGASDTGLDRLDEKKIPAAGWKLTRDQIQAAAFQLGIVGLKAVQISEERSKRLAGRKERFLIASSADELGLPLGKSGKPRADLAIFVALQMEREVLVRRWGLKKPFEEFVWRGKRSGREILVFGPDEMGRVPAAIETMRFLYRFDVDLLLVAGIAGGFKQEEVDLGDVVVAKYIADLASRKMREREDAGFIHEFRPRQFDVDRRIEDFLKSSDFDKLEWERSVVDEGEWPDGRRPTLRYGPLASLDEVVSSSGWIDRLLSAWPKLFGVEMEAGGVCAAAHSFGKSVAVVRGISDQADPAKSDTAWRRRSMKGVARLIEMIIDGEVIFGEK
jgi:nucleoside phosphorylase